MDKPIEFSLQYLDDVGYDTSTFVQRWSEPQRVYHDLHHISQVIGDVNQMAILYTLSAREIENLYLGAWYHDIIYVPGAKDNEAKSAYLAEIQLPLGTGHYIAQMVLKTKDHVAPETFLQACLIDADLAGLGREQYHANSFRVKDEYPGITDEQWMVGRLTFLESFLARNTIYHTSWGARLEQSARSNMQAELDYLTGKA